MINTEEILVKGMNCLVNGLGIIEAEQFITTIIKERFDYTKWQRKYFDDYASEDFHKEAVDYAKNHPFKPSNIK